MYDFDNIQTVPQPKNMKTNLYRHQLASIYNMEKMEIENIINIETNVFKKTKIAVNADITGYGKTLSMLGLIIRDKMTWDTDFPDVLEKIKIESEGLIKSYEILRFNKLSTTLILMSQNIIGQWVAEIEKTELKYKCILSKNDLTILQAEDYDIILVIPSMYNKLVTVYSTCSWKRFIFDEPGNLKVPGMLHVQAGFYWFLTATPPEIFNHHYRCSKGTFMRDIIGASYTDFDNNLRRITIKNHPDFIKASFEMPKTFHFYYQCYQPIYNVIHSFVNDNIKSMIDSGNIEGAILALGGDKTANIVELILEKKQNELLEVEAKISIYRIRDDKKKIEDFENKKSRINIQIKELDSKFKDMLNSPCNICCEPLENTVLEINCQNLFCGSCLFKWLERKNTCPTCRAEVDPKKLIYIDDEGDKKDISTVKTEKNMTKLQKIVDIIDKNREGKYLIFSDHDGTYTSISSILEENNISCVQIKGNMKTTERNLYSFKHGNTQVIFLNSKYNGAGINLQEATDIILYHEMNFNVETQLLGRANRIGRKTHLNVHHLQIKSY